MSEVGRTPRDTPPFERPSDPAAADRVVVSRLGAPLLRAHDADGFLKRLRGLHAVPRLGPTDALILRSCFAIHTFGLSEPIDAVFLAHDGRILKVARVPPGRVALCGGARTVVELAAGTAARLNLERGQVLSASTGRWS